jgi:16S rRNA pseudouridine516 synthase
MARRVLIHCIVMSFPQPLNEPSIFLPPHVAVTRGQPAGADATLVCMRIAQILYSQGFGSRRECAALLARGEVQVASQTVVDPHAEFNAEGLLFTVGGMAWPFHAQALLMLNKPANYECSRQPKHHASVLSLLPAPLRTRGVQPVGRLDADTTGLLLLTDDGQLIHRLTSPKQHVPKVYEVACKHEVSDAQITQLLVGVLLHDDPTPAVAVTCQRSNSHTLRMTLTDGRYHQVKRMLAAVGNRVESLHRSEIGALHLPADLAPGRWRWLNAEQRALLFNGAAVAVSPDAHD